MSAAEANTVRKSPGAGRGTTAPIQGLGMNHGAIVRAVDADLARFRNGVRAVNANLARRAARCRQYREGMLDMLARGGPWPARQYCPGSVQFDAYYAGVERGVVLYRRMLTTLTPRSIATWSTAT